SARRKRVANQVATKLKPAPAICVMTKTAKFLPPLYMSQTADCRVCSEEGFGSGCILFARSKEVTTALESKRLFTCPNRCIHPHCEVLSDRSEQTPVGGKQLAVRTILTTLYWCSLLPAWRSLIS